jgi:O-antigen ligase
VIAFILLILLVFTIPWEKSVIVPGVGTLTRLLGVAAVVAALPKWRSFRPNGFLVAASAFVAWSACTWFWSLDRDATAARIFTYGPLLVLFILVSHEARVGRLMQAYVAGAAIASLLTMVRYSMGLQTYWRRYAAPGFDPNDLGITVAIAIPLALHVLPKWPARAAIALFGSAILLTASRTALIGACAALVGTALFSRKHRFHSVVLLLLILSGALLFAPEAARQRIATTTTEISRGTLHHRTVIWKAGLRAWRARPVAGAGAGAYPDAVEPLIGVPGRAGHEYVAHNVFLSVLVETGVIGFALFACALAVLALFVWVLPNEQRLLWTIAFGVWLIGAATLTWEHRKPTWLLPALACSMWVRSFQRDQS